MGALLSDWTDTVRSHDGSKHGRQCTAAQVLGEGDGSPGRVWVEPREVLLDEFAAWLRVERGLAAESVRCYRSQGPSC